MHKYLHWLPPKQHDELHVFKLDYGAEIGLKLTMHECTYHFVSIVFGQMKLETSKSLSCKNISSITEG